MILENSHYSRVFIGGKTYSSIPQPLWYFNSMGNTNSNTKILEFASKGIPIKKLNEQCSTISKSIFFIRTLDEEDCSGMGSLLEFIGEDIYHCIVTCSHVIQPNNIFEAEFKFGGSPYFKLKREWIGSQCFKLKGQGDFIAIELKPVGVDLIIKNGLKFMTVKQPKVGDEVLVFVNSDSNVTNPELNFQCGAIQHINDYTLEFSARLKPYSSGSPLVLWTGEAVGIHIGRAQKNNDLLENSGFLHYATSLQEISKHLMMEIKNKKY